MSVAGDGSIRVRSMGASWTAPEVTAYENEAHLQRLIAENPEWIPGVDDDAVAVEELHTSGGSVDVCVVGRDGSITVVECKLASNSERRRMVVGQVIDYASAISSEPPGVFIEAWQTKTGQDLGDVLEGASRDALERNIAEARIDLCLAVDSIDVDLRRLVEYLNRATRSDVRVTALQLMYAREGDVEILVPSSFGGEIADAKIRGSDRQLEQWTRESFIEALSSEKDRNSAAKLFGVLESATERYGTRPVLWFGQRPRGGIYLHVYGYEYPPAWISVNNQGELTMCGTWKMYPDIAHHEAYAELAAALRQSHLDGARGVPVASLDLDHLVPVLIDCAVAINTAAAESKTSPAER